MSTAQGRTASRPDVGRFGEELSCFYLTRTLGWELVARNWRSRWGELDIVATTGQVVVVVEVRTRTSQSFGTPQESVDARKQRQLLRLTEQFMVQYDSLSLRQEQFLRASKDPPTRIDIIALCATPQLKVTSFEHLRNVISRDECLNFRRTK